MSKRTSRRVAIAFPLGIARLLKSLHGISKYAREHGRWSLVGSPDHDFEPVTVEHLRHWRGDGAFAFVRTAREARIARCLKIPIVNLSGVLKDAGVPRVHADYEACGRLAAEHLLERGFSRFAYYGLTQTYFSNLTFRGFLAGLGPDARNCSRFKAANDLEKASVNIDGGRGLEEWLRNLRPPVGLLASHDPRGAKVIDICQRIGLRVPQDVAVVGVANDELMCEISNPPLTSVDQNGERTGWEAAAMLDRLMNGQSCSVRDLVVPPEGVVARASTDVTVIADPIIAAVAQTIQERASELVGIDQIVATLPRSRRWLEQRFRECLRMSPYAYLCRARIKRAEQLLKHPEAQFLNEIAARCGFRDSCRFRLVFRRYHGMTPAAYRELHLPNRTMAIGQKMDI